MTAQDLEDIVKEAHERGIDIQLEAYGFVLVGHSSIKLAVPYVAAMLAKCPVELMRASMNRLEGK